MPHPNEFFSKEFILKLYRELDNADTETKVQFTLDYIDSVKVDYPLDLVEYMTKTQLANIYFDQEEYKKALPLLEEINALDVPKDTAGKHLYILLLIRTNRLLGNFNAAFSHLEQNLLSEGNPDKGFDTLDFLEEYQKLCQDTGWAFDPRFKGKIDFVVESLGFEAIDLDSLEMIDFLAKTNLEWNVRMGKIILKKDISGEEKIELHEAFIKECPIEWYRAYSRKSIQQLNNI
ncbi:tetratricopeptide repeat protein [Algoriphagus marincola]|uniref:Tetratricopeptide repeat protein n=1 Tax=Algoriphagus marincola TaxID=264027 RepID=A0ABS7N920_9BACT|nr:tetratricopeptide repeat protein [Algoriphagus marincola]MBY5952809.1 tetratricopeptide repeat protein [Algoriphagus marincola]